MKKIIKSNKLSNILFGNLIKFLDTNCVFTLYTFGHEEVSYYLKYKHKCAMNMGDVFDNEIDYNTANIERHILMFEIYKGTPIVIYTTKSQFKEGNNVERNNLSLSTFKTEKHIKHLKEFFKICIEKGTNLFDHKWRARIWKYSATSFTPHTGVELPLFDNIFISENKKNEIKSTINNFINNKEWYTKHKIPYHFGILLYGPPGTGKTTLSKVIARYVHTQPIVMTGDNIKNIDRLSTFRRTNKLTGLNVIIIEDIDTGFDKNGNLIENHTKFESNKDSNDVGFGTLLNYLDGMYSLQNTIFIFTTNYIDRLPSALIRPGRVDVKIAIGSITLDTLSQFTLEFYGKPTDESIISESEIPNDLTFAKLQIEVMKHKSYDELISYIKEINTNGSDIM